MKISVVIPNYNGFELFKNNLPSVVEAVSSYEYEIIIVDDFSDQRQFEQLEEYINKLSNKKIKLFRNNKNLGFASTMNRGIAKCQTDFVVFLNSDVLPSKDFLKAPIDNLVLNSNLFGVGLMDESVEGEKTIMRGRGLASWKRGFLIHRRGEVDKQDTFWISGGSSIIRRKLFEDLGGFDELYNPFYWEDIDLSYRARKAGYEIMFERSSIVRHFHSEGAIKKHYAKSKIKTIAYRNQFIFIWKNIEDTNLLVSHLLWLPYHLIHAMINFDTQLIIGFVIAVTKLPDIINKRRKQGKHSKMRDREIINL